MVDIRKHTIDELNKIVNKKIDEGWSWLVSGHFIIFYICQG